MFRTRLKPLAQQTIVLTGATSGIGLATARLAARRGAKLVVVSRNEDALRRLCEELRGHGTQAEYAVADVADRGQLEQAARKAEEAFGGFDSWVNDAGTSVVGELEQTPIEEQRRLFETNYWGVVNGSLIAAGHLRQRGGAVVNLGSVLSDRAIMLQGTYSASKHAVKGFTDSLRMELEASGAPVSVTLIKPSGIDTPFQEHARNRTDAPGIRVPPPAYDPKLVARAILHACEHPTRDLFVGAGGAAIAVFGNLFPRLTDLVMERVGKQAQVTQVGVDPAQADALEQPKEDLRERSPRRAVPGGMRRTSLLLEAQLHPAATAAAMIGLGALAFGALAARNAGRMALGAGMLQGARRMAASGPGRGALRTAGQLAAGSGLQRPARQLSRAAQRGLRALG